MDLFRKSLADYLAAVGETEDTIEEVFEPHLLRVGHVQKTARGRIVTASGLRALGLEPPATGGSPGLFDFDAKHS